MNYIDLETFSETPIKHGTYRYASSCEAMICTYAFGDGPVQTWDITADQKMPGDLAYILDDSDELLTAHSSMFDRNVLRYALGIDIPIPRWRDTMVKALSHGLPGGLDILCDILKVPQDLAKIKDGRRLIHLFCKPLPANSKLRRATRATHPQDWKAFLAYAANDVSAMRDIDAKLPTWNYRDGELALWRLDQRINDRGLCVDTEFAKAAIAAVEREQKRLKKKTQALTSGGVASATQRDRLLAHIVEAYGIELPDMQMATLERRLNDPDLPIELRELLAIRLQASSTSTGKYAALLRGVQEDGRLRGTLQFAGAARTRRWAGRTFQPHNLPRPDLDAEEIAFGIEAIKAGGADLLVDDVMGLARNAMRGAIIAPPGKKLVIADLANIEGRAGAWMAGEEWKLQAFLEYDAGHGPDLYNLAYAKSFNVDPDDVTKDQRQIGKVQELMLQYAGGVGAFVTGAATYGIDLADLARTAGPNIPGDVRIEAEGMWKWCHDPDTKRRLRFVCGLEREVFVVCDSLKRMWRREHPEIVSLWTDLEEATRQAIARPGNTVECRMFKLRREGAWLRIRLPSGNYLCYPSPQVADDGTISYMGMNQYSKTWCRISTYGGKIFENECQGVAGDVLKAGMPDIEAAGYEIVLTVHDSAMTETPDDPAFSAPALAAIITKPREWTTGLPLAAAGFETYRYRKD